MARLFGTDGVRGLANVDLTAPLALELGEAAARLTIQGRPASGHKPKAIIGRDTRISGGGFGERGNGRCPRWRCDHPDRCTSDGLILS